MSWPATAVVAYLKFLPVRRPVSGADVEASVDVVPHCIQYNEGAKPGMMGNEKGYTQGINWSVEHAQTKTMKAELCDGRISSQTKTARQQQ